MQSVNRSISAESSSEEKSTFPRLLDPGRIGTAQLTNRVIMGAMHTRFETLDRPLEREIAFYRARVDGEVGAIISGGFSPDPLGRFETDALVMHPDYLDREYQRTLTQSVTERGVPFFAQLLHAGRYAHSADCVGASSIRAPINKYTPRALSTQEVEASIEAFAAAAEFALECGYSGIEVMGSEGSLINQFLAPRTNQRDDKFGGGWDNRRRYAIDIVRTIRRRIGRQIPLLFRVSVLDLVEDGMTHREIVDLAQALEAEEVDAFNTGIGWHESRVPTVAQVTPRAAFANEVASLRSTVSVPVIASNRINDPQIAEDLLKGGVADFISVSRQMLADPDFVSKAREGRPKSINTCIACNQACLDSIFVEQPPSCLVNPRAGREIDFPDLPVKRSLRIAVIGGGVAGMTAAAEAAAKGHKVTLFEQRERLGGLVHLAQRVPGKGEFSSFLRYLTTRLEETGVDVHLSHKPTLTDLKQVDGIIDATGALPRPLDIPGVDHPSVATYEDILSGAVTPGARCVIVGAGGIGVDVAEYLLEPDYQMARRDVFASYYGISEDPDKRGGLDPQLQKQPETIRNITILQRSPGRLGKSLSITTDWIKRERLMKAGVRFLAGVTYEKIDDDGLHISTEAGFDTIPADTIILCAGQISNTAFDENTDDGPAIVHKIGGARHAAGLDAYRAMQDAIHVVSALEKMDDRGADLDVK